MKNYQKLEKHFLELSYLEYTQRMLMWDEHTVMPSGGSEARSSVNGFLASLINLKLKDKELESFFQRAKEEENELNEWQLSNLKGMQKAYKLANALPSELVEKRARLSSTTEMAWRKYRKENNWKDFVPHLEELFCCVKNEANYLAEATGLQAYDSLIDTFQPGIVTKDIDHLFDELKNFLPAFVQKVIKKQQNETPPIALTGNYPEKKQEEFNRLLMEKLGFDFNRGRLDQSIHPFCGGVSFHDVRITTRYNSDQFFSGLMGVIHETGHAKYEQNLPKDWIGLPVGKPQGMGVHEGMSLMQEKQIGCDPNFLQFLAPLLEQHFFEYATGSAKKKEAWEGENLSKIVNQVNCSLIRVEADEVTYSLHIILRYEIEKALFSGAIEVKDIPALWDELMMKYLKVDTKDNYANGCMQDIHWPMGWFGYFPNYALGLMYSAQIFEQITKEKSDVKELMKRGDFTFLNNWQKERIWNKGSLKEVQVLLQELTGKTLQAKPFIQHLQKRYLV